jgi:phosphoglycerate dehydrogenase-like enzyme
MSKGTILITDTIFVDAEDEAMIKARGFSVERCENPCVSEDELCQLIKGKTGYILGGIEKVTEKVLQSADQLRAISFCGTGYHNYIPAYPTALKRGIHITNVPGTNAMTVAEYGLALMLMMTRDLTNLTRIGDKKFQTVRSVQEMNIGIIGFGHIGQAFAKMIAPLEPRGIYYFSRTRKLQQEKQLNASYVPLNELLAKCDVVFLSLPYDGNAPILGANELKLLKRNALVINIARPGLIDFAALRTKILAGEARAAYDIPPADGFGDLPLDQFVCSNASTAFNTFSSNKAIGETAAKSLLNILETGADQFAVSA